MWREKKEKEKDHIRIVGSINFPFSFPLLNPKYKQRLRAKDDGKTRRKEVIVKLENVGAK